MRASRQAMHADAKGGEALQMQLLLYINNISIYIILSNIRIQLPIFCCICNTIAPKAKDKLQKYSKIIEYFNVLNMQIAHTAFFCASSVIILPGAKIPQNALKWLIGHIRASWSKVYGIRTKCALLLYIIQYAKMHKMRYNILCNITSCNPDIICYT